MATPTGPNPYRDSRPFSDVKIAGVLLKSSLVEIDGIKIEDEWNVQKPVGSNGATAVFKGTKIAEAITLTLEAPDEESFDDLRVLWDLIAPKPGGGGAAPATPQLAGASNPTTGATANTATPGATSAVSGFSSGSGGTTGSGSSSSSAGTGSTGPRPPTVPIENAIVNYIGVLAVARKAWEGPLPSAGNSWRVKVTFIQNKPPTPAGVGAQKPAFVSASGTNGNTGANPQSAADAELAKLQKQASAL